MAPKPGLLHSRLFPPTCFCDAIPKASAQKLLQSRKALLAKHQPNGCDTWHCLGVWISRMIYILYIYKDLDVIMHDVQETICKLEIMQNHQNDIQTQVVVSHCIGTVDMIDVVISSSTNFNH